VLISRNQANVAAKRTHWQLTHLLQPVEETIKVGVTFVLKVSGNFQFCLQKL